MSGINDETSGLELTPCAPDNPALTSINLLLLTWFNFNPSMDK